MPEGELWSFDIKNFDIKNDAIHAAGPMSDVSLFDPPPLMDLIVIVNAETSAVAIASAVAYVRSGVEIGWSASATRFLRLPTPTTTGHFFAFDGARNRRPGVAVSEYSSLSTRLRALTHLSVNLILRICASLLSHPIRTKS